MGYAVFPREKEKNKDREACEFCGIVRRAREVPGEKETKKKDKG
jgi:hypothetical protein